MRKTSPEDLSVLLEIYSWLAIGTLLLLALIWGYFKAKIELKKVPVFFKSLPERLEQLSVRQITVYLGVSLIILVTLLSMNVALGILLRLSKSVFGSL